MIANVRKVYINSCRAFSQAKICLEYPVLYVTSEGMVNRSTIPKVRYWISVCALYLLKCVRVRFWSCLYVSLCSSARIPLHAHESILRGMNVQWSSQPNDYSSSDQMWHFLELILYLANILSRKTTITWSIHLYLLFAKHATSVSHKLTCFRVFREE